MQNALKNPINEETNIENEIKKEAIEIYKSRLEIINKYGDPEVYLLHTLYEDELIERYYRIVKYLRQNHSKRVKQSVIDDTIEVLKKVSLKMTPEGQITNFAINGKDRKISLNTNGYETVNFKRSRLRISRIYAMLYITLPSNMLEHDGIIVVDHIDENKVNNNINNLQWLSNSENIKKALKSKPKRKMNKYKYLVIEDSVEFHSQRQTCEYLGVATLTDYFAGKCYTIGGKTVLRCQLN